MSRHGLVFEVVPGLSAKWRVICANYYPSMRMERLTRGINPKTMKDIYNSKRAYVVRRRDVLSDTCGFPREISTMVLSFTSEIKLDEPMDGIRHVAFDLRDKASGSGIIKPFDYWIHAAIEYIKFIELDRDLHRYNTAMKDLLYNCMHSPFINRNNHRRCSNRFVPRNLFEQYLEVVPGYMFKNNIEWYPTKVSYIKAAILSEKLDDVDVVIADFTRHGLVVIYGHALFENLTQQEITQYQEDIMAYDWPMDLDFNFQFIQHRL